MAVHVEWLEAKAVRVDARHAGSDYRLTLSADEQVIITGPYRDVQALAARIAAAVGLLVAEQVVDAEVMCGGGCVSAEVCVCGGGRHRALEPELGACRVPPPGWVCTRDAGHDGPCAAHPITVRSWPVTVRSGDPETWISPWTALAGKKP